MGILPGRAAAALLLAAALAPSARAEERLHNLVAADRPAQQAWAALLRDDSALARDARRHGFRPARDLAMLRVDLNGDGRPELLLYANLASYCGSAGCMLRILAQAGGRWRLVCETYAEEGIPLVIGEPGPSGWRALRGTYAVQWVAAPPPTGVTCVEGEAIPRDRQGHLAAWHR